MIMMKLTDKVVSSVDNDCLNPTQQILSTGQDAWVKGHRARIPEHCKRCLSIQESRLPAPNDQLDSSRVQVHCDNCVRTRVHYEQKLYSKDRNTAWTTERQVRSRIQCFQHTLNNGKP